jgi:hypothetical protein
MRIRMLAIAALVALVPSCTDPADLPRPAAASAQPAAASVGEVSANSVEPDRRIGAMFLGSQSLHTCSGAVLDSRAGDLIITAAHCIADGVDAYFVPGFANHAQPQDFWHLDAVYLDPRWLSDQDPAADYAIARVSTDGGRSVESEADGGFVLGPAPQQGTSITVTGYTLGIGGGPVGCSTVTAAIERGFPALPCAGLSDGTSGSPWVSDAAITGLTGGLDGGGCDENVSYSAPFGDAVVHLLERAEAGGEGDSAPASLGDGC